MEVEEGEWEKGGKMGGENFKLKLLSMHVWVCWEEPSDYVRDSKALIKKKSPKLRAWDNRSNNGHLSWLEHTWNSAWISHFRELVKSWSTWKAGKYDLQDCQSHHLNDGLPVLPPHQACPQLWPLAFCSAHPTAIPSLFKVTSLFHPQPPQSAFHYPVLFSL